MTNTNSEKRGYLEQAHPPTSNSQPLPEHPDYLGSIGQEDVQASSSSGVPPAYTDMERGFNNGGPVGSAYPSNSYSPNAYSSNPYPPTSYQPPPMNSPPYNTPYQLPQQQQQSQQYQPQQYQPQQPSLALDEPICLTLLNPRMISSGFTAVMPDGLHRLAPRPVDPAKWTLFMQELNDTLRKAPGTITQEVTDFWLVHVATLGIAGHARNMFQSRVEGKAAAIVERYNRAEFAAWGIRVHFDVVAVTDVDGSGPSVVVINQAGRRRREERRQRRDDRRGAGNSNTLELVIERA
ncbi:hypothetical protein H4R27_005019 [Coemansia aciculifera]|nr:hypothetical protein H4R27_005019 [Coemansia aciculifera]